MKLSAACAQITCQTFAPDANRAQAARIIEKAAACGAQLVLLPEFLTTGCVYDSKLYQFAEPIDGPTAEWMKPICRATKCWVGAGIIERDGNRIYNTLLLIGPDGECHSYRKRYLPFFEKLYFHRGPSVGIVETEIGRLGLMICWDMVHPALVNAMRGQIDLLLIISAWPDLTTGNVPLWGFQGWISRQPKKRPRRLARDLGIPVVYCNRTGLWETHIPGTPVTYRSRFAGSSSIIDAEGRPITTADHDETVISGEVAVEHLGSSTAA